MEIEKLDRVALSVKNLEQAITLFSGLFDTIFYRVHDKIATGERKREKKLTEHADPAMEASSLKVAVSPIGLELIEADPPEEKEGVRSFHFKVANLEQAKAQMKMKGIRLLAELQLGDLKEAIYSPDDLHGARIVLAEYKEPLW